MATGPNGYLDRWLFLARGWQWNEADVWRLTECARSDADFRAGRARDARRHDPRIWSPEGAEGFRPLRLPTVVVCPGCQTPQRLEARDLGLDPFDHKHATSKEVLEGGALVDRLCCGSGQYRGMPVSAYPFQRLSD